MHVDSHIPQCWLYLAPMLSLTIWSDFSHPPSYMCIMIGLWYTQKKIRRFIHNNNFKKNLHCDRAGAGRFDLAAYRVRSMAAPWGEPSVPPPHNNAFRKLLTRHGKKSTVVAAPSFIKCLETVPEIVLPLDQPMRVAVSLAERGLVGQFMGLWSSTKTTDNWIQRN